MAGDCTFNTRYANDDTFGTIKQPEDGQLQPLGNVNGVRTLQSTVNSPPSPYFEEIGGSLYRKKLERGFVQYREVLADEKRLNAIATFHQKRPGRRHHTLEDTYRFVAEHYWWEGMYLQVREYVLGCEECKLRKANIQEDRCVSRTMMSHSQEVLSKLKAQQEAGLFCDITLKTGGGHAFSAHKAVLAAVSEYFQEVFTEMDSSAVPQSYIDLTGFSEESFIPLLEFSYTSTMTLKLENLPEVSTMARHLRMWPALEACKAIQREQASPAPVHYTGPPLSLIPGCSFLGVPKTRKSFSQFTQRMDAFQWKRKSELIGGESHNANHHARTFWNCTTQSREHNMDSNFSLVLEDSDRSEGDSQLVNNRQVSHSQPEENGFPCSPTRRLKLMDFKSPSSKRTPSSCSLSPTKRTSPVSQRSQPARLLRSSPKAALALRRLLPKLDSSFKGKRRRLGSSFSSASVSSSSTSSSVNHRHSGPAEISAEVHRNSEAGLVTPTKVKQESLEEEIPGGRQQEEVLSPRTQEKYRLLSVLGLQRKSLLPGPDALTGWKQKNRLRKPKVNNYSLTVRRKPKAQGGESVSGGIGSSITVLAEISPSFSICDMTRVEQLRRVIKSEPLSGPLWPQSSVKKKKTVPANNPLLSTVKNTRSKVTLPPLLPTPCETRNSGRPRNHKHIAREKPHVQTKPTTWQAEAPKKHIVRIKQEPEEHPRPASHTVHPPLCSSTHLRQRLTSTPPRPRKALLNDDFVQTRSSLVTARTERYNSRCMSSMPTRLRPVTNSDRPSLQRVKVRRRHKETRKQEGSQDWSRQHSLHQHPLYKAIKEEPADPLPLSVQLSDQEMPDLGKRQSKLPVKLLDPGFLFSFCRPPAGMKKEEESVDICLTRSVSHANLSRGNPRHQRIEQSNVRLRSSRHLVDDRGVDKPRLDRQGTPQAMAPIQRQIGASLRHRVKKEPEEKSVTQKVAKSHSDPLAINRSSSINRKPQKNLGELMSLHGQRSTLLESIRRARLKKLRGPSAQAPRGPHACQQCGAAYRDCDALIMHRLRHIEGKHWPCPLCSKTFFRQKNVRNHIRNHDPKLYKCRQCMAKP